ncbi:transporter substrate-binding domain-containing protein [Vibrio sp. S4M6]|uniref:substrate-binding periplasmic protein n=1 Tax=Vibrio sinus TaxID=2946865 RepID=UPI00202A8169|nr:transporter substrate-binding domain-containing protein [Vibrio sinus]MCL9783170.1 transporter substrate-binding domain-containing protein [Vibrio sinus]
MRSLLFIALFAVILAGKLHAAPKITYCFGPWSPVHYLDENNKPSGLFVDLTRVLFKQQLGWEIEYRQLPWKRCQNYIAAGLIDFMVTVNTPERIKYSVASEKPIYHINNSVYTYRDHERLDTINNITTPNDIVSEQLTVVTYLGNGWYKANLAPLGIQTTYIKGVSSAINLVALKRTDLYIGGDIVANHQIKTLNLDGEIIKTRVNFEPYFMYVMVSKKSSFIDKLSDINIAIEKLLASEEYQQVISKYQLNNQKVTAP